MHTYIYIYIHILQTCIYTDKYSPVSCGCRMRSTTSLPSLLGPLWPGVVASDKVLSMGQIEETVSKQMTDAKLWLLYSNPWNYLTLWKN